MKLTRERKIFAAVLGLAVAAFAIDRVMGGGSGATANATASAVAVAGDSSTLMLASISTDASGNSSSGNVAASATRTARGDASLSHRFTSSARATALTVTAANPNGRDLFRTPAGWSKEIEVNSAESARQAAEEFVKSHRLSAVAHNGESAVAVVEGRLLHVGAAVEGFTLISIMRDAAIFSGPCGVTARLALKAEAVR